MGVTAKPAPAKTGLLHTLLDAAAVAAPGAPAVRDHEHAFGYRRLAGLSHAAARVLAARGIGRGDRVVVRVANTALFPVLLFGAARLGAIFVPLNPAMKEFHIRPVLADAAPSLVVVDDEAADTTRALTDVPVAGIGELWSEVDTADTAPVTVAVDPDDAAVLVYTSGSTAAPKAVVLPHSRMTFASAAIGQVLGYRSDDVVYCRIPLSFDYGLYQIFLAVLARAELVIAGADAEYALVRGLNSSGATVVPLVPALAGMLVKLAARERVTAPVRLVTNTGAALPQSTIDELRAVFEDVRVVRMYGITECKRVTIMPPEQDRERPGSVGLPLPGTTVVITGPDGEPLPAGETGEIVVHGPTVMPGYWRAPELTARMFRTDPGTGGRCLHTGDYGHFDEDGYLYFEGRRDDTFKRRGARMSTIEIEAAAMDVPGVRGAVALPPEGDRDLLVFVVTELAPAQVLRELARRLEPAKVPAACRVLDEIPLTPNGKSARRELAASIAGPA